MTNRKAIADRESGYQRRDQVICKSPRALIYNQYEPAEVVLTVRDPRAVVTSNSHHDHHGEYTLGWDHGEGQTKWGLKKYWKAMKPYLDKAHIVRYEELTTVPDAVQTKLGERFQLTFSRPFSTWPEGFAVHEYWLRTGLTTQGFKPPRDWRDSHKNVERVQRIEINPGFRECCETLGY